MLQWTEFDPGFDDLFLLESVGDGRVIGRAWEDGDSQALFGERVVVSASGTGWTEVPLPEGLFPDQVNISSGRWVVTGRYPDVDSHDVGVDRVFFSDDQGATWTEMVIELPSDSASPYAAELWRASPVLVAGKRMVLALTGSSTIDGQALLEDLGLLPAGKRVVFSLPTPDGMSFTLIDADASNAYATYRSAAFGLASIYGHFEAAEVPPPTYDELELTYEEVGFTEADFFDLFSPRARPLIRIFTSDGPTGEVVTSYDGFVLWGAATEEGLALAVVNDIEETVLTSPDGLVWSEDSSFGPGFFGGAISADGTIWWTVSEREGSASFEVQRARLGETPTTVAEFEGLQYPAGLLVGPAGLVVLADSARRGPSGIGGGLPESRVARDGYELRFNEPEGGLSLWDLTKDTAVYVFGPEDTGSETPPEGVRQINDGQSVGLVFEDPETGADLVTFTGEDLASLVGMTAAELEAASSGDPERPEQWVGWSADGTAWGWESLADAFGIDDGEIWAEFAVGRDFVIARVVTFQLLDPADSTGETSVSQDGQVLPTRWFIAKVP